MPTWNPSLAVGVTAIDEQHQELFARADVLLAAMRAGKSAEEVRPLLEFLDAYCARHFASEERVMRERGYPAIDEHLAQHRTFIASFQRVAEQFELKGPSPTVTITLQQLVCGWLVGHIGAVDKRLAAFLAGQQVRITI